jgi:hypothetical protein
LRPVASASEEEATEALLINRHAERLAERHGARVWRLGLDGGFGCPNRPPALNEGGDGRGRGGCIYCAPSASRAPYAQGASIAEQLGAALAFARRRYGARLFFPYFQAFSSTWAPVDVLRRRYDEALRALEAMAPGSGRGLVISTRPDCVDEEKAALLASYAGRGLEVWVELGLQSGRDSTLARIRRGHTVGDFMRACRLLALPGLRVAAHLILGLPGENRNDMLAGTRLVSSLHLAGVKFHDLHVPRGSILAGEYLGGEVTLLSRTSYLEVLADAIELLAPETEIIRIATDSPETERFAPRAAFDKAALYRGLEEVLASRETRQGSGFSQGGGNSLAGENGI